MKDARSLILEQEAERWMSSEVVTREALRSAEQDGIVFIDEIGRQHVARTSATSSQHLLCNAAWNTRIQCLRTSDG